MSYTPGPWSVRRNDEDDHDINAKDWVSLATVYTNEMEEFARVGAANAKLIAAAPDLVHSLLEALEFVEDHEDVVDGDYGQPKPNRAMSLARTIRDTLNAAGVKT